MPCTLFERLVIDEFQKQLNTCLPISVFEADDELIVVVGERVYINIDPCEFVFVSDVDAIRF